jgi:hypothetical protein
MMQAGLGQKKLKGPIWLRTGFTLKAMSMPAAVSALLYQLMASQAEKWSRQELMR